LAAEALHREYWDNIAAKLFFPLRKYIFFKIENIRIVYMYTILEDGKEYL